MLGLIPRFCSVFLEPGYYGQLSAILLFAKIYAAIPSLLLTLIYLVELLLSPSRSSIILSISLTDLERPNILSFICSLRSKLFPCYRFSLENRSLRLISSSVEGVDLGSLSSLFKTGKAKTLCFLFGSDCKNAYFCSVFFVFRAFEEGKEKFFNSKTPIK